MSMYDLIPDELYENLPDEPHDKFVLLANAARSNLARLIDDTDSSDFVEELRSQFISTVSSIADALGIAGLPALADDLADYRQYQTFQVYLSGVIAKVRLQGQLVSRPYSVNLGRINRARIHQEIEQLRFSIDHSDLPDKKKTALLAKLTELEAELTKQRLSFAKLMAISAAIMSVVGGSATALANGPEAAQTVMRILAYIGEDKEREDAERLRLLPPPAPALPDLAKAEPAKVGWGGDDLDDDIPF